MASLRSLQADVDDEARGRTEQKFVKAERRCSQVVCVREENEVCAMNGIKRFKAKIFNSFRRICLCSREDSIYSNAKKQDCPEGKSASDDGSDDGARRAKKQYRLQTKYENMIGWKQRILSVITCCYLGSTSDFGLSSRHHWISSWMHWIFRIHLLFAFVCMCVAYFAFAVAFAGLIVVAGVMNKQCVRMGNFDFGESGSRFYDAFYLSWTTFATVGYGSVYPALSNQNEDHVNCAFISAITSFEALIGIMYTGFCGAVLFAKVLNIRNMAMVAFSDPIVIRYGCGVENTRILFENEHLLDDISKSSLHKHHMKTEEQEAEEAQEKKKVIPCPVLEFRISNLVWDKPNGVYIDARLNVVANVDANDVDPSLRDALDPQTRWKRGMNKIFQSKKKKPLTGSSTSETVTDLTENSFSSASDPASQTTASDIRHQSSLESSHSSDFFDAYASIHGDTGAPDEDVHDQQHQHYWRMLHMPRLFHRQSTLDSDNQSDHGHHEHYTVDDDPTSQLVTKRIFSKMHLESTDHPYFKRVWLARHILNEHSPVLTPRVRRLIRRNHGNWPEELNSFEAVRKSMKFNQIVVSFQGVCNATATTVYSQKLYDFEDVNVGYQFSDMLMLDEEGNVLVDCDKINHVREQNGGGGEPLIIHADNIV